MWGFIVQINIGCCNWFNRKELEPCADYIIFHKGLGERSASYTCKISFLNVCVWELNYLGAIGFCHDTHMASNIPHSKG
jgi:hypothetical protein